MLRMKALLIALLEMTINQRFPYREGNGHTSRLLATLMALQAGLPLLDFSEITGKAKQAYFFAVQASITRDYAPMKAVFNAVLNKTERSS